MRSTFFISLRLLIQAKYLQISALLLVGLLALSFLASEFSARMPATVAVDVGLSVLRLFVPFLTAFVAQELFSREFERRYYLNSLSYPLSRNVWVLGRLTAATLFMVGFVLLAALLLNMLASSIASRYVQGTAVDLGWGFWLTIAFQLIDYLFVLSVALFFAITARSPSFVIVGTIGITVIARSYAAVIALLQNTVGLVRNEAEYQSGLSVLYYFLPDLGALDVRAIALYGKMALLDKMWPFAVAATLAYTFALIALSVFRIKRKALV